MPSSLAASSNPVPFGEKLACSASFDVLFRDGMALVEKTAAYLDGTGREDSRRLGRAAALSYASESMRLTTRLMQIASWLLLQRAVNEGEMSVAEACTDKGRTCASWSADVAPHQTEPQLPVALRALIGESLELQTRIQRLDTMIRQPDVPSEHVPSALETQRAMLRLAFPS